VYAVFWRNEDEVIDKVDASREIIIAADNVGKKYLDPEVYRAIRSERYRPILRKSGEEIRVSFKKKDIESKLNEKEKSFQQFLEKNEGIRSNCTG